MEQRVTSGQNTALVETLSKELNEQKSKTNALEHDLQLRRASEMNLQLKVNQLQSQTEVLASQSTDDQNKLIEHKIGEATRRLTAQTETLQQELIAAQTQLLQLQEGGTSASTKGMSDQQVNVKVQEAVKTRDEFWQGKLGEIKDAHSRVVDELHQKINRLSEDVSRSQQTDRFEQDEKLIKQEAELSSKYREMLSTREKEYQAKWEEMDQKFHDMETKRQRDMADREREMERRYSEKEEAMKTRYETMMKHWEDTEGQKALEAVGREQIEKERRVQEEEKRHQLEIQLRQLRKEMMDWQNEYQKQTQDKYEELMKSMEDTHTAEVANLKKTHMMDNEKVAEEKRRLKEKELKHRQIESEEIVKLKTELAAFAKVRSKEDEKRYEGKVKLTELCKQVSDLWSALDTSDNDRVVFLEKCVGEMDWNEPLADVFFYEVERLKEQIPIVEIITRREFIKQKLLDFFKHSTDPMRLFQSRSGRLLLEDKQRNEFIGELTQLNNKLVQLLSQYERKHDNLFLYKGEHYLEHMSTDIRDMERQMELANITKRLEKHGSNTNTTKHNTSGKQNASANHYLLAAAKISSPVRPK
eukprot:GFYU01070937.1.p1 GENE.GFYU01070937.1~~GFYU01070937.1.p1  ORF type:complete len:586 (+),score=217.27 GFYU01070937.1:1-1758(+)